MGELDCLVVGGERHQHRVVEDEIEAEGQRQRDQHRRRDDAVDDAGLQHVAERIEHGAGDDDRDERMNAEVDVGEIRDVGAEHDERAVQDVDDVQHAPDQRKADRDARV